ncbi:hypothetical protein ACHHYP_20290 [Achlya hypogyna]|uniref:Uncharacterized protein n=1 Tax=Achlya hypogyna TaxID=1202772 RepID=A0A1V9YSP4_ACHHY|nr:hypothetical protein ACHHYP_20290 [Achlya hypogyna]
MADYDAIMAYVVRQRPRALTVEERLDILYLHAYYRKQGVQAVAQVIASAVGRSVAVVRQVWTQYKSTERVVAAPSPSNSTNHRTRVPDTKLVLAQVQEFLREKRLTRTRVVAKDVMVFLQENGHVQLDMQDDKDTAACLKSVQTYLG